MIYGVHNTFTCVAVRYIVGRFVVSANLFLVGDVLGEDKSAVGTFVDVELLTCGESVNAGKTSFYGFAFA